MRAILIAVLLAALLGCASVPDTWEEAFAEYDEEGCKPSVWSEKQAAPCLAYGAAEYCDTRFGLERSWMDRSQRSQDWVICAQDRFDHLNAQYWDYRRSLGAALTQTGQMLIEESARPIESCSSCDSQSISSIGTTGFLIDEGVSGLNKICFYNAAGSVHAKNVGSANICPVTAEF